MKWFYGLVLFAATLAPAAVNPQLKQVTAVYILSMTGGMDQFLANRLTASGVFIVVADAHKADAVITDRLGESFETKLNELYPPPAPAGEPKPDKSAADDKKIGMDLGSGAAHVSGFSRGKGNFFIVDRKSRNVLWAVFEPPKDSSAGELSKTAEKVVKRLKIDLTGAKVSIE
jgi:hypothetical protein